MGGLFGVASSADCVYDLFYGPGTDRVIFEPDPAPINGPSPCNHIRPPRSCDN